MVKKILWGIIIFLLIGITLVIYINKDTISLIYNAYFVSSENLQEKNKETKENLVKTLEDTYGLDKIKEVVGSEDEEAFLRGDISKEEFKEITEAKKEEVKEETKKTIYYVGDIYKDRDIKMTYLNAYEFTDFNDFNQPKDGYIVICAEFEVENISDSDQTVMYTDFNGYADGYEVEQSYSPEGTGMDFSLNLSAGRKGKGIVAFEVPIDSQEIQIEFSPNMFSDDKVIFSYK